MAPEHRRKERSPVEWGGFLRKRRSSEGAPESAVSPAGGSTAPGTAPPAQRRAWASGAFLAAAARLVARGEESGHTLRRVVEWATAATGARRAALWALETSPDGKQQLSILAWAAVDGWRPAEDTLRDPLLAPALQHALQHSETIVVDLDSPLGGRLDWLQMHGIGPIALCAAISSGDVRGILAVAGNNTGVGPVAPFGEDARAALTACAALAAIIFDRRQPDNQGGQGPGPGEAVAEPRLFPALPDRAMMLAQLTTEISRAERFGHPLALLTLDLDRFGDWSRRAGQHASVNALDHLTRLIRASIRDVDVLGRDDDAFILILPVSEADDALRVGERIRLALRDDQPLAPDQDHPLTLSGGAVGHPDDGSTAADLLVSAERTTAYAKRMGRDQIRIRGLGEMEAPSRKHTDALVAERAALAARTAPPLVAQAFQGLVDALTAAGDAHDQARPGHGRAVGRYSRALAEACGLDPEQARAVELAGTLHDTGKIGLPAEVLAKRGPLTTEERAVLREQPAVGKLILMQISSLEAVIPIILHAQERYDGTGYPEGLHGNQILFGARIIAIAEGYEAMTNDRPYRKALSHSMAIAELWREAGGRYDPRLVDTFVRLVAPLDTATQDEGWKPELLERVALAGEPADELTLEAAPAAHRPATGGLGRSLLPTIASSPAPVVPGGAGMATPPDTNLLAEGGATMALAPGASPVTEAWPVGVGATDAGEPIITSETAWLTWSDLAQPPTRAEFWGTPDEQADFAPAGEIAAGPRWEEAAEQPEAIFYEEVISATRLELNTGELVPPPSLRDEPPPAMPAPESGTPPRPATGSLPMTQGLLVPAAPSSDEAAREADDSGEGDLSQIAALDDGGTPERLSVEDTMLVMSQTNLLRLSKLQRLTKRRTGYLFQAGDEKA